MPNTINVILVIFLLITLLSPFIIIPMIFSYNSIIKKYQRRVDRDTNEDTVRNLIKILKFSPLLKYEKKLDSFIETFKKVNKSKSISTISKKELYDILIKKGCNMEGIKLK